MCIRPCLVRLCLRLKVLLQSLHWKVFSLLWDILWLCRLPAETKLWEHWSHWYGFLVCSPHVIFVIYFNVTSNNLFWSNVFKTMFGQNVLMFKWFVAIIAFEILLLSVTYFVAFQITRWSRAEGALVTVEWLFSSLCTPHVHCHVDFLDTWQFTLWTFVRLFSRVGHLMQPHICNCRISTLVALMRLYPGVCHNVFT